MVSTKSVVWALLSTCIRQMLSTKSVVLAFMLSTADFPGWTCLAQDTDLATWWLREIERIRNMQINGNPFRIVTNASLRRQTFKCYVAFLPNEK